MLKALITFVLVFFSSTALALEVNIAAASNFSTPIKKIAQAFEKKENIKVNIAVASSGKHFAQIINGAPFHIFLSADQSKPAALEKHNLARPGRIFTYAQGQLVLVTNTVRDPAPRKELVQSDFQRLALANPKLAPYGAAAKDVLDNLGLVTKFRSKWVVGENIAQAFQFLSSGNASLGFVALSQIQNNARYSKQQVWLIPEELYRPIRQDAVLLKQAEGHSAALSFYKFLQSSEAQRIIVSYGYKIPRSPVGKNTNDTL